VVRIQALLVAGLTLILGGAPLVLRADGFSAGDPDRGQVYRATGLGLTAVGVPALWLAAFRGPPAAGGSGRRIF
jgi:hypothetical protein